jgi:transposase
MVLNDPHRRRVDGDAQLKRDRTIAELREQDVSFREIAKRLGVSLGTVQKGLVRWHKREADIAAKKRSEEDEDEDLFEAPTSMMSAEQVTRWEIAQAKLELANDPDNRLWLWRLSHYPEEYEEWLALTGHPWMPPYRQ